MTETCKKGKGVIPKDGHFGRICDDLVAHEAQFAFPRATLEPPQSPGWVKQGRSGGRPAGHSGATRLFC